MWKPEQFSFGMSRDKAKEKIQSSKFE